MRVISESRSRWRPARRRAGRPSQGRDHTPSPWHARTDSDGACLASLIKLLLLSFITTTIFVVFVTISKIVTIPPNQGPVRAGPASIPRHLRPDSGDSDGTRIGLGWDSDSDGTRTDSGGARPRGSRRCSARISGDIVCNMMIAIVAVTHHQTLIYISILLRNARLHGSRRCSARTSGDIVSNMMIAIVAVTHHQTLIYIYRCCYLVLCISWRLRTHIGGQ